MARELLATIEWDTNNCKLVPFTRTISSVDVRANGGYAAIGDKDRNVIEIDSHDGEMSVYLTNNDPNATLIMPVMFGVSVYKIDNGQPNIKPEASARLAILLLAEEMANGLYGNTSIPSIAYKSLALRGTVVTNNINLNNTSMAERGIEFFYTDNEPNTIHEMASLEALVASKLREHGILAETRVKANAFRLAALVALLAHVSQLSNFDKRYKEYIDRYKKDTTVFDLNEVTVDNGRSVYINGIDYYGTNVPLPRQTYVGAPRSIVAGEELVFLQKYDSDGLVFFLTDILNSNPSELEFNDKLRVVLMRQSRLLRTIAASYEIAAMMGASDEQIAMLEDMINSTEPSVVPVKPQDIPF